MKNDYFKYIMKHNVLTNDGFRRDGKSWSERGDYFYHVKDGILRVSPGPKSSAPPDTKLFLFNQIRTRMYAK